MGCNSPYWGRRGDVNGDPGCGLCVSWHVVLVPKVPLGKPIHVDGISMYKLDLTSGKIIEHQIDNLMINDTPVIPPYGIFSLVSQDLLGLKPGSKVGVPAGI